jgi:hypothetical protein
MQQDHGSGNPRVFQQSTKRLRTLRVSSLRFYSVRREGIISRVKLARRSDQPTAEAATASPPTQSSHKETSFGSIELLQG